MVQFNTTSVTVMEGSSGMICVILQPATDSTNMLGTDITVNLAVSDTSKLNCNEMRNQSLITISSKQQPAVSP